MALVRLFGLKSWTVSPVGAGSEAAFNRAAKRTGQHLAPIALSPASRTSPLDLRHQIIRGPKPAAT
jgi:hypothetical protein